MPRSLTLPGTIECRTVAMRGYQKKALGAWDKAGRRGVIVVPTGAGKTVIAMKAIELVVFQVVSLPWYRVDLKEGARASDSRHARADTGLCFEKDGVKVYLEVVGFWTPEYLERKITKLNSIAGGIDMIIAADEGLACSKLERLKGRALVIYYKTEVPTKPIIEHLKQREASIIREQADKLNTGGAIALNGDVVSIKEIADQKGVAVASLRMALQNPKTEGYVRIGDLLISRAKLNEIDENLRGVERLVDALGIIEASGVKEEEGKVLETLGYTSIWEDLEMDKVRISKMVVTTKTTSPNVTP